MQKVRAVQDESSHWYVIPDELAEQFFKESAAIEQDPENYDMIGRFEDKFSKYMTGGDLNNVQLYAEIKA